MKNHSDLTVLDIEKFIGIDEEQEIHENSSLSVWYHSIREKKLSDLTDGDIARFIRQKLYLQYVLVEALRRLWANPMSGEIFDGELLSVISRLDRVFWETNMELSRETLKLVGAVTSGEIAIDEFDWLSLEDKNEYLGYANTIENKIGELK